MGRIRSLHPGLATDDEYMALSHAAARILPLLWCECDDQGIFEWKPRTLKARLLPVHNEDMAALLAELEVGRFVKQVEIEGKSYGLVRNFRKFQRPKKPNATHLLPDEFRTYVGLSVDGGELDDDHGDEGSPPKPVKPVSVPQKGEKSPQMEDGGDKREEVKKQSEAGEGAGYAFEGRIIRLTEADLTKWRSAYHAIPDLVAELTSLDAFYDAQLEGKDRKAWFVRCSTALGKKHQEWTAKAKPAEASGSAVDYRIESDPALQRQRASLITFRKHGKWYVQDGPKPGDPGCRIDPALLKEFGYQPPAGRAGQ